MRGAFHEKLRTLRVITGSPLHTGKTLPSRKLPFGKVIVQMLRTAVLLVRSGKDPIEWQKDEAWQEMYRILGEQGIIEAGMDPVKASTLRFLKDIYGSPR